MIGNACDCHYCPECGVHWGLDHHFGCFTGKAAEVAAEQRRYRLLCEAVAPFVAHYEPWMDEHADDVSAGVFPRTSFGQLRALKRAVEAHYEPPEDPIADLVKALRYIRRFVAVSTPQSDKDYVDEVLAKYSLYEREKLALRSAQ